MKLKFFITALLICSVGSAQDFIMKKKLADRYYSRFDYYKAIPMYEQLMNAYPGNFSVSEKLADSYRRVNDSENAEKYYAILMDSSSVNPNFKLYYAQALARNGKYERSAEWYQKYAADKPDDIRGKTFAEAYKNVKQFEGEGSGYDMRKAAFNSSRSDFSPAYFGNGVVFSSARKNFSIVKMWYNWTVSSYLDLYFSYPDSIKSKSFSKTVNSMYHEGPVTFTPNQDTIIFTRSNYNHFRFRKSSEGVNKLKLYQARFDKITNKWTGTEPLPFNSDQYSAGHPALAEHGTLLYFASDMPGGYGGTDIYVSRMEKDSLGKNKWGNPRNLGPEINTPGNEMFPFADEDGNLWFASNGLAGMGGLDVFVAYNNKNGFSKPENPGNPLNSRFDDFGIITRGGGREGLITSDRYSEVGNDDIYAFTLNRLAIKGKVFDISGGNQPIEKAIVQLIVSDGTVASQVETSPDGNYQFPLNLNSQYTVKVSKKGYSVAEEKISTIGSTTSVLKKDIGLNKAKAVLLFGTIADKKSGEKLNDVEVYIIDTVRNAMVLDTTTSTNGDFRKELNTVQINDRLGYNILLNKKGYLTKKISFKYQVTSNEINLNDFLEVSLDKIDVGTDIGKLLQINPIYFDLGKSIIRADAATELDKVVRAMQENPTLVIELGSHTDARGSSAANLSLSDKRAKASAEYVISKGIERTRIYGKGYGETLLLNRCGDGVKCSEEEHAANRRTEFKIVKF